MLNLGFSELCMIFFVALIVFGPEKLPELAKTVGRALRELRRMTSELQTTMHETVATIEEGSPKTPSLKELVDRIDPKRIINDAHTSAGQLVENIRPFAEPAPGSPPSAPPAIDTTSASQAAEPIPEATAEGVAVASEAPPESTAAKPALPAPTVKAEKQEQTGIPADHL